MITALVGVVASSISQGSPYDPDAQAFFTAESAAGVTLTPTQETAVNNLVVNLKAAGIWSKFRALYPIVGGTATAHKFNLINPADTDAAFRFQFFGGWVHSATGMLGNTSLNTYANTFLNPSAQGFGQNEGSYGIYSRTIRTGSDSKQHGVFTSGVGYALLIPRNTAQNTQNFHNSTTSVQITNVNTAGMLQMSRTSSTNTFQSRDSYVQSVSVTSTGVPNANFYFGARNNGTGAQVYDDIELSLCYIAKDGFTLTELQVINQIVEGYQYELGRNINPAQSFYYNPAYNNETNAFLYSTQITDTTIQTATNTLVSDLKTAGVWTKMKAVYPMVGGTATTHKFNLVNPADANTAFRLSFIGGWTHTSNGIQGNGTNNVADTFLTPSAVLSLNNTHTSIYSRTNNAVNYIFDVGTQDTSNNTISLALRDASNGGLTRINESFSANWGTNTNSACFYLGNRTASNVRKTFINNALVNTNSTASTALPVTKIGIGANYYNNTPASSNFFSNRQYTFVSIGDGLTDTESLNLYTAVQNFQTTLGRAIFLTPPTVSDSDAQAFINAANILDQVEAPAINNLVIGLKADNLWTKMKAIYPMVGQIATSQKYNLKDPQDTNAAFRLNFTGGWTHSFNGVLPNGTNAYANTFLPFNTMNSNSQHLSYYSRTNLTAQNYFEMGCGDNSSIASAIIMSYGSGLGSLTRIGQTFSTNFTPTKTDSMHIVSANSTNVSRVFENGIYKGQNTGTRTDLGNRFYYLGAANQNASNTNNGTALFYTTRQCAFASIGTGLTDTEAANLYTRVQTFNTALQRQVP
jgi:hypothetical protein